jgi:hypothetical protein
MLTRHSLARPPHAQRSSAPLDKQQELVSVMIAWAKQQVNHAQHPVHLAITDFRKRLFVKRPISSMA